MGSYTDNLTRRRKRMVFKPVDDEEIRKELPRLVSVAIMRDGTLHKGFKSHAELRRSLGDKDPYKSTPGDEEGFYTSDEQFVPRHRAKYIAADAGQARPEIARMGREFLSSDIDKW